MLFTQAVGCVLRMRAGTEARQAAVNGCSREERGGLPSVPVSELWGPSSQVTEDCVPPSPPATFLCKFFVGKAGRGSTGPGEVVGA